MVLEICLVLCFDYFFVGSSCWAFRVGCGGGLVIVFDLGWLWWVCFSSLKVWYCFGKVTVLPVELVGFGVALRGDVAGDGMIPVVF